MMMLLLAVVATVSLKAALSTTIDVCSLCQMNDFNIEDIRVHLHVYNGVISVHKNHDK